MVHEGSHVKARPEVQGVPGISPSIKNAIKCGSNDGYKMW